LPHALIHDPARSQHARGYTHPRIWRSVEPRITRPHQHSRTGRGSSQNKRRPSPPPGATAQPDPIRPPRPHPGRIALPNRAGILPKQATQTSRKPPRENPGGLPPAQPPTPAGNPPQTQTRPSSRAVAKIPEPTCKGSLGPRWDLASWWLTADPPALQGSFGRGDVGNLGPMKGDSPGNYGPMNVWGGGLRWFGDGSVWA
jgi:hypothetical protein